MAATTSPCGVTCLLSKEVNLLFRWFLDMDMVEPGFDPSTFSKNRQRLIEADIAKELFFQVVEQARRARLLSHEHFTVDGDHSAEQASVTVLEAVAPVDFTPPAPLATRGGRYSAATHDGGS